MTGLGRMAGMSSWVWILGLQLLLVLPFVGQPIHLDDPIFVDIGRNVLKTPWHAHDFPYCFDGGCVPDMASHSHPPFVGYWIGLLLRLFGEGPRLHITLHLGFLVFPLLFAAGMYRLALRFAGSPPLAAAVAIASPTAVVMSHNLNLDFRDLPRSGGLLFLYRVDGGWDMLALLVAEKIQNACSFLGTASGDHLDGGMVDLFLLVFRPLCACPHSTIFRTDQRKFECCRAWK